MAAHTISGTFDDRRRRFAGALLVGLLLRAGAVGAQDETFTYQGQLTEAGTPANGNYDLQFALFGSDQEGTPIGTTQTLSAVAVSNGLFTVDLDFGISPFTGDNRFLEVAVRPAGGGSFTTLTPRQFISSTPYAIRSLNAGSADLLSSACTGCVQDTQIQSVTGSKVTGTIPAASVPPGSENYIQNGMTQQPNSTFNISGDGFIGGNLTVGGILNADGTGSFIQNRNTPQPNANFSISGNGTAGGTLSGSVINANTQYNIGGSRVLSTAGAENLFAGAQAGTNGFRNAFFGREAGSGNQSGTNNVYVGFQAGQSNTTGGFNTFVGSRTGPSNTTGVSNVFVGDGAGGVNTGGMRNVFVGEAAGNINTTGSQNTLIGYLAGTSASGTLTNATAIGANANVAQSNSLVLGSTAGVAGGTQTNVGIGTTAPTRLLALKGLGSDGFGVGDLIVTGTGTVGAAVTLTSTGTGGHTYSWISTANAADSGGGKLAAFDVAASAYRMVIDGAGNVGIGTTSPDRTLTVNGTADKPGGGSWGTFSDERLKNIKGQFTSGLNAVMGLRPLRYEYKRDNALEIKSDGEHVGFSAQDVQRIIPEAVSTNDKGYLLVNNDPILWTMLNAIKEQQHQIEQLRGELRELRAASTSRDASDRGTCATRSDPGVAD